MMNPRRYSLLAAALLLGPALLMLAVAGRVPSALVRAGGMSLAQSGTCEPDGFCVAIGDGGYQFRVPVDWQPPIGGDAGGWFDEPASQARVSVSVLEQSSPDPLDLVRLLVADQQATGLAGDARVANGGTAARIAVPNADAAAIAGMTYLDSERTEWVAVFLVAARDATVYLLTVAAMGDYLRAHDAEIGEILASFQLIP